MDKTGRKSHTAPKSWFISDPCECRKTDNIVNIPVFGRRCAENADIAYQLSPALQNAWQET